MIWWKPWTWFGRSAPGVARGAPAPREASTASWRVPLVFLLAVIGAITIAQSWQWLVQQLSMPIVTSLAVLAFVAFVVLFMAALGPEPKKIGYAVRRRVFYVNSVFLVMLLGIALVYYRFPFAAKVDWLNAGLHATWFGVLGSVAVSFKGVTDHPRSYEWDEGWWIWYLERPFMGALVGVMTYLVLFAANPTTPPTIPALAVAAFVLGTQEQRFFSVIYEVAGVILATPAGLQDKLTISTATAVEGDLVILGSGFKPLAKVQVGDAPVNPVAIAADGTSLAGPLPAGPAGSVRIFVLNPDGSAAWVPSFNRPAVPPPAAPAPPPAPKAETRGQRRTRRASSTARVSGTPVELTPAPPAAKEPAAGAEPPAAPAPPAPGGEPA